MARLTHTSAHTDGDMSGEDTKMPSEKTSMVRMMITLPANAVGNTFAALSALGVIVQAALLPDGETQTAAAGEPAEALNQAIAARQAVGKRTAKPAGGRSKTVYILTRSGENVDRVKKMGLTPQQMTVWSYIRKQRNGAKGGFKAIAEALDMNYHSVDGAIYALRTHEPALVKSVKASE